METQCQTDEQLSWTVHPLVENWKRSALLGIFLCFLFFCIYWGFRSAPVVVLSALFLLGSLYKYFLPFRYQCATDRLIVTACCYRLEQPWATFRSSYVDANGILLSPFAKPTRLENFRGVYVRFGTQPSESVVDFIRARMASAPTGE